MMADGARSDAHRQRLEEDRRKLVEDARRRAADKARLLRGPRTARPPSGTTGRAPSTTEQFPADTCASTSTVQVASVSDTAEPAHHDTVVPSTSPSPAFLSTTSGSAYIAGDGNDQTIPPTKETISATSSEDMGEDVSPLTSSAGESPTSYPGPQTPTGEVEEQLSVMDEPTDDIRPSGSSSPSSLESYDVDELGGSADERQYPLSGQDDHEQIPHLHEDIGMDPMGLPPPPLSPSPSVDLVIGSSAPCAEEDYGQHETYALQDDIGTDPVSPPPPLQDQPFIEDARAVPREVPTDERHGNAQKEREGEPSMTSDEELIADVSSSPSTLVTDSHAPRPEENKPDQLDSTLAPAVPSQPLQPRIPAQTRPPTALSEFRSSSTSRIPSQTQKHFESKNRPSTTTFPQTPAEPTIGPNKTSPKLPSLSSSLSASMFSGITSGSVGISGSASHIGHDSDRKRRWARGNEAPHSLDQVAARYRSMANEKDKLQEMKNQLSQLEQKYQHRAHESRMSMIGTLLTPRKVSSAIDIQVSAPLQTSEGATSARKESVRREGGALVGPQGSELTSSSIERMLSLLSTHRLKPIAPGCAPWEMYLEYYLTTVVTPKSNDLASSTSGWTNTGPQRPGEHSPQAKPLGAKQAEQKEREKERATERERRQEAKFRQHWNDQAFKLASSSSPTDVAKYLSSLYSLPIKRLNLLANCLRNDSTWNAFSATVPSLNNLQFTCQTLVLSLNELTQIPIEICRLVNLRHLYISFNKLTSLPTEIAYLKHLTVLEARGNEIATLPWSLYEMTSLRKLDLSQNRLPRLHSALGNLIQLNSLNLAHNQLNFVPYEIGAMEDLRELNVQGNQLSWLPESIAFLSSLNRLEIGHNRPSSHMNLYQSILTNSTGAQALVLHFQELLMSHQPPSVAKVYVLGNDGSGKSSLIRCLRNGPTKRFTSIRKKPAGIRIVSDAQSESLPKPLRNSTSNTEDVELQFWEFSGRVKMVHHMFWSNERKTTFVVVWDVRQPEADSQLEMWFKSINAVCQGGSPPSIVVVGTHLDGAKIDNYRNVIFNKYASQYPSIRFATAVSCNKSDDVMDELRIKVRQIAAQEIRASETIPLSFRLVERVIAQQAAEWNEWALNGAYAAPHSDDEFRLGNLQIPVLSSSQFSAILEFCHVIRPSDSSRERRRKLENVRNYLHSQGSAFWFAFPGHNQSIECTKKKPRNDEGPEEDDSSTTQHGKEEWDDAEEYEYEETNEEGEHRGRWALIVDLPWLLNVLNRLVEPPTSESHKLVDDRGVLYHKHLSALWGDQKKSVNVPNHLYVRLHSLLEALEIVWTPYYQVSNRSERDTESISEFLNKGYSIVPYLFQPNVPYNWIKWHAFLGRPATDRYEGEMQIDKVEANLTKGATSHDDETELYLEGMVGDIKFERWWIFPCLPESFLSRFLLRLLHSARSEDTIALTPDVYWANGAVLVNDKHTEGTSVILTVRPFSSEVNKSLRTRARPSHQLMEAMIFKATVWEKHSPPGEVSYESLLLIELIINTFASLVVNSHPSEFSPFCYFIDAQAELPCPHCLLRYRDLREEARLKLLSTEAYSSASPKRSLRSTTAEKRCFVPHLFGWASVLNAVETGKSLLSCDNVSRVRVDALVPELIPRETHLMLTRTEWEGLASSRQEKEWDGDTGKVLTRSYEAFFAHESLLLAAIGHLKCIAWMLGDSSMRQYMHRIVGLYVSERQHSGMYQIGVAMERGQRGIMLSHYLDLSADSYSDDPLPVILERIRIAIQLCKAILFLGRLSPPFLLGSHIEANNVVLHRTNDSLQPKLLCTIEDLLQSQHEPTTEGMFIYNFGRLLLNLFVGSRSEFSSRASVHVDALGIELSMLNEYSWWEATNESVKKKILSIASACLKDKATTFELVLEKLAEIQKALEPSIRIAIIKSFHLVKRVSAIASDAIQCLAIFNHGGDMAAGIDKGSIWAGCSDGSLWIYDLSSEAVLYSKIAHAKRVLCIASVEDGSGAGTVWTSSVDQTIKLWKAKEGKMIRVLGGFNEEVCAMRAIRGNMWCGTLSGKLFIWDLEELRCLKVHELGAIPVWSVISHGDQVWAAVGSTIVRFNAQDFSRIDELRGHTKPITCLISVGGEVWSGGQDHTVRVWNPADGQMTHTLSKHSQKVYSLLAYSDQCVWSGSWDKTIIVWNTQTKEPLQILQDAHDDAISALVATQGATPRVWSASWDKSLCIWE